MIGQAFLAAPCIDYDRATYEQRAAWRWAMLGDRCDLPDWRLSPDERERLAGRVDDEHLWNFRRQYGFTLYRPLVSE